MKALVRDTHKFESRYLDRLIGSYPEEKATYQKRSPALLGRQVILSGNFLSGLEDKVVPPNQAEAMVDALKKRESQLSTFPSRESNTDLEKPRASKPL
ncbi:MAG: hypothetical protein R3B54_18415 [Bdellovibrionota bacterium]